MPYINLKVTAKPDPVLSERIAKEVSQLTKAHLRKDPTITAVGIDYVDPAHWFSGGNSLAEQGKNTFWLDIKVVDGTNTKAEMAAYLEAVFESMSKLLGGLHHESYILVHEVPAPAYGFGGKTQEFRFISGMLAKTGEAVRT
ncbi:MAG: 4-oxalocrotonate tautomerase family protein [Rhodospirillales bacterium]|nr:4-oxalocrotonate tautomerase family protein [Rhodospirillales bacterium]